MDDRTLVAGAVVLVEAPFLVAATVLGAVPVPVTVGVLLAAGLVLLCLRLRAEGRRVDQLVAEAVAPRPATSRPPRAARVVRHHHRPERRAS